MLLNKTAHARTALQAGADAGLSLMERRILILADGKRNLDALTALLGADILPIIDRLLREGYLQRADSSTKVPTRPSAGVASAFTGLLRATADVLQPRNDPLRAGNQPPVVPTRTPEPAPPMATTAATGTPAASARQRRSLVAAKMYLIDMLQLQRHPDAVEHKARIQFADGNDALLAELLAGVRVLYRLTPPSYAGRIIARLGEVLPEPLLPMLAETAAELQATTPSAGNDAQPTRRLPAN